jgi:hypothetical protein
LNKLIAITLLVIHLFNFAGYNLLFQYFIARSETHLVRQLDANRYEDQDLVELKVPLNLPYYNSSGAAERVDGEIEISGTHYNYVKRQVRNDTLYLYCIPNTAKTKLQHAQNEYSKGASDTQPNTGKESGSLVKKMKWGAEYSITLLPCICSISKTVIPHTAGLLVGAVPFLPINVPYKPPKAS